MKIQLLAFPDCPNAATARDALREAMRLAGIDAAVEEVDTSRADSPAWARAWGSPTILIDGADVAGGAPGGDAACRLDHPSVDQIRARLTPPRRGIAWPVIGGVVAAVAASACCVVPAVLAIVGVTGAGVASSLAPLRSYFLVATGLALAIAFWFAYRPSRVDACGCETRRSRRRMRLALWLSTISIAAIAGYPLVERGSTVAARARGPAETELRIKGMDCAACTKAIAHSLSRVSGVATVDVDYERGIADVTHDGTRDPSADLIAAVESVGYEAEVVRPRAEP